MHGWGEGGWRGEEIIIASTKSQEWNCAYCVKKKMNQWELSRNTVTIYSIQEHVASSHGQPTDITPIPLLFFQTHTYTQRHTIPAPNSQRPGSFS